MSNKKRFNKKFMKGWDLFTKDSIAKKFLEATKDEFLDE